MLMSDADSGPPNDVGRMKGLALGVLIFVFGIINAWYVWYRYFSGDAAIYMPDKLHFEIGHAIFWMVVGAGIFAWNWFGLSAGGDSDERNPDN
jgi:hypothetical protein